MPLTHYGKTDTGGFSFGMTYLLKFPEVIIIPYNYAILFMTLIFHEDFHNFTSMNLIAQTFALKYILACKLVLKCFPMPYSNGLQIEFTKLSFPN